MAETKADTLIQVVVECLDCTYTLQKESLIPTSQLKDYYRDSIVQHMKRHREQSKSSVARGCVVIQTGLAVAHYKPNKVSENIEQYVVAELR